MTENLSSNLTNILVISLLPLYIYVHIFLLPTQLSYSGISDSGFISIITLTFLACTFLTLLTLIFNTRFIGSKITAVSSAYVLLIYFLREADFHRLFTEEHVTRGAFYSMASVPMWQKLIAAAIFILLAICILILLFKHTRTIIKSIRAYEPWAIALLLWFSVLLISQLCDKSGMNDIHAGRVIEECCECWASIFLFLACIQFIPLLNLQTRKHGEQIIYN